jgi:hypothetical protein
MARFDPLPWLVKSNSVKGLLGYLFDGFALFDFFSDFHQLWVRRYYVLVRREQIDEIMNASRFVYPFPVFLLSIYLYHQRLKCHFFLQ